MSQSRRIPFFPDAPTHVSISIISPLQNDKSMLNPEGATIQISLAEYNIYSDFQAYACKTWGEDNPVPT